MNRVNFLSSGAAAEFQKVSKAAAEEFSSAVEKGRVHRMTIPSGAHPRLVEAVEIARGPKAPVTAPSHPVDKFYMRYYQRYIKRGRCAGPSRSTRACLGLRR